MASVLGYFPMFLLIIKGLIGFASLVFEGGGGGAWKGRSLPDGKASQPRRAGRTTDSRRAHSSLPSLTGSRSISLRPWLARWTSSPPNRTGRGLKTSPALCPVRRRNRRRGGDGMKSNAGATRDQGAGGSARERIKPWELRRLCHSGRAGPTRSLDTLFLPGYIPLVDWDVEHTDEFESWWNSLTEVEQESVNAKVILLQRRGPALRRPHSDVITSSKHSNMKELIIQHAGKP